ncbi:hypothetical protein NEMBOFW57_007676 [Staphylotrichum longicolle]|uniref:Peptidase M14 domain-containing protein n=1 Tax=Staphylotrichum longicolle TaxID=669026 RepID=A0AAD4HYP4_9PEZI|nr:hypothetical protein NEMBOFW57_007676 [Staphylotrichum longicolle]
MKFTAAALLLVAPLALAGAVPKPERKITYDGYKAYRIATHGDAKSVKGKLASFAVVPFNLNTNEHFDVAIPGDEVAAFEALGFEAEVLHNDLGADIMTEGTFAPYQEVSAQAVPSLSWFDSYHAYADHVKFFNDLQGAFPNVSEIIDIGASSQGRQLFGIHIWGSGGKGSKPAIYFHGTVHAREWITAKVVEYLAYNFLTQYSSDATVKAIRDTYDIYILPFVNPDGFVYTQTNDRLWRKNRQSRSGASCVGTDINRNWPYKWELTGGASTDPCDETYKGKAAGDTPENKALVAFTQSLTNGKGIKLYIDWHSYGQYILFPYGTDYIQDVAKAEFAWTIELRPKGSGSGGFVLPAAQILPSAIEQWEGMKYLLAVI